MRRTHATAIGAVLAGLTLIACGAGSDPDGDGATIVEDNGEDTQVAAAEEDSGPEDAAGTRPNPLAPGTTFAVGDWTVELAPTNTDAEDVVRDENIFNDPPADGRQFVLVEVTVTYTGDDSGTPWLDLSFDFYGSDGNTFGSGSDDYCGVIPDSLNDHGEMFPDASATGNVCVSVPADQIDGGAWIIEETFSLDSSRTFVAVE